MIGLIRGLFGKKNDEPVQEGPSSNGQAFYLNSDDAKTLGDIDYMRSVKSVRRTFPKEKLGADNAFVQAVSATEKVDRFGQPVEAARDLNGATINGANGSMNSSTNGKAAESPAPTDRRRSDDSMDMFRNMARDINKR